MVVVFKEKALFNFVRTFLRELDLLALDLNLSLFDRATTEKTTTKSRGIARFRWSKHSIKGGGGGGGGDLLPFLFLFFLHRARDDDDGV